jgi:hypothetical protein
MRPRSDCVPIAVFGAVLLMLLGCFGAVLLMLIGRFGAVLLMLINCFGAALLMRIGCFGVFLLMLFGCFGAVLLMLFGCFGVVLLTRWDLALGKCRMHCIKFLWLKVCVSILRSSPAGNGGCCKGRRGCGSGSAPTRKDWFEL